MDVKQSQKAGNNAIQIQQTVVGDNNYIVGIEIENDSRKPNDNQPKRSLLRRLEYRIGLLTLRQYGKYWRLIPKVDTPWWLATPYGTPNCSPYANGDVDVWYVSTDGSYYYHWYYSSYGVRPALYFPSTLWVSTEDEGEAGFCLADVPLDDLLAEIKSRAEE